MGSSVDFEEDEDEELLQDLVHDQEEAGPSGTERTQPPTTSVTMVQVTKKMRSMGHLPVSYVVHQGP
ncbi:hypothetical protein CHARACLAT_020499 [Characodon lateralis]|uniref:Uncharacterized protein n=1 Tax=Characodon lateralis TaxID=208331 RepID=A0ABU7E444_9TELE|nr:hypothetical protein [Characodon lateralis]